MTKPLCRFLGALLAVSFVWTGGWDNQVSCFLFEVQQVDSVVSVVHHQHRIRVLIEVTVRSHVEHHICLGRSCEPRILTMDRIYVNLLY